MEKNVGGNGGRRSNGNSLCLGGRQQKEEG